MPGALGLAIPLPRPYGRRSQDHRAVSAAGARFPAWLAAGHFEILIVAGERLERLPWLIFVGMLAAMAFVPGFGDLRRAAVLAAFYFSDWLILSLLVRLRISFGPAKPPTLALTLLRLPAAFHASAIGWAAQAHGTGQIRLPFLGALYPSSLYGKRFEVGRRAIGRFTLYVTRGLGMEGKGAPRVRFLSPPDPALREVSGEWRPRRSFDSQSRVW